MTHPTTDELSQLDEVDDALGDGPGDRDAGTTRTTATTATTGTTSTTSTTTR